MAARHLRELHGNAIDRPGLDWTRATGWLSGHFVVVMLLSIGDSGGGRREKGGWGCVHELGFLQMKGVGLVG